MERCAGYEKGHGLKFPPNRFGIPIMIAFIAYMLASCSLQLAALAPDATSVPFHTPVPLEPAVPPTPTTISDWETLAPGLERRTYSSPLDRVPPIVVLRIDPTFYSFRVQYRPGKPLTVQEWQDALPGAAAFVNASFFSTDDTIKGLLVADSAVYGQTYRGFGGMFQVQNGQVRVRSLIVEPYQGEALEQAVQAFPMLVLNGQTNYSDPASVDASRRTVVAQDTQGRILLMSVSLLVTLPDLSAYLPTTDLGIVHALNLDGGKSTMMAINVAAPPYLLASFDAVPAVLAVYKKG